MRKGKTDRQTDRGQGLGDWMLRDGMGSSLLRRMLPFHIPAAEETSLLANQTVYCRLLFGEHSDQQISFIF